LKRKPGRDGILNVHGHNRNRLTVCFRSPGFATSECIRSGKSIMTPAEQAFDWIEHTDLSLWIAGDSMLAFPSILTVHVLGTGFLAGTSSAIALRILGVARQVPLGRLDVFYPILWVALAANILSGTLLLIGYPYKAFTNPLFYLKLSLVALAIYLVVKIRNEVLRSPPAEKPHAEAAIWRHAKILAGLLLACWMSVIAAGRFLAYTHTWLRVGLPASF
jgi:hypothetical protein